MPDGGSQECGGAAPCRAPVLLLHGFPGTRGDWEPLCNALGSGYRVFAPAMPWIAGTSGPSNLTVTSIIASIARRLAELPEERYHVVGHDMGGAIAWWLAAYMPNLAASIAVCSAPHPIAYLHGYTELERSGRRAYLTALLAEPDEADLKLDRFGGDLAGMPKFQAKIRESVRLTDPARLRSLCRSMLTPEALQLAAHFPGVRCPALVCYGTDDPYFPPAFFTRSVAECGPRAVGLAIPGGGHYPHLMQTAAVADGLAGFWARVEAIGRKAGDDS